jgi:hypothetical protein
VLTAACRARATQEAREVHEEATDGPARDEMLLIHRAQAMLPEVLSKAPGLGRLLETGRVGMVLGPTLLVGAALLGLASNALGPSQQINILFAPMLGLVAWNLVVYALVLVTALRRAGGVAGSASASASDSDSASGTGAVTTVVGTLARRLVERSFSRTSAEHAERQAVVASATARFARAWGAVSAALMTCRLTRLAHLGSMLLVFGAVGGMYVRGLGLLYRASWQSTFLDAEQVSALLNGVLGPASLLIGSPVPDVTALEYPADGEAAPWIHLWALTGVLFVAIPRCVLWFVEGRRIRRLEDSVPLDLGASCFRKILAPVRGEAAAVDIVPYGVRLAARSRDGLVELLHDVMGARAEVCIAEPLAYGDEAESVQPSVQQAAPPGARVGSQPGDGRSLLILFGLAQSPESEVHGVFVEELSARLHEDARMAVLVDGAAYRIRITDARRLEERRRAWDRVLRDAGVPVVHVDLDQPLPPEVVDRLDVALRPRIQQTAR